MASKRTGKSEYAQKLLDPRWQKKRLEILQRDEWMCQICGDGETTLHVHHRYYERGKEPWDYPNTALQTLCAPCHEEEWGLREQAEAELLRVTRVHLASHEVAELARVLAVAFEINPEEHTCVVIDAITQAIEDPEGRRAIVARHWEWIRSKKRDA